MFSMTTSKYRPRDFVLPDYRKRFGQTTNMVWVNESEVERVDELFAAKLQARAAAAITVASYTQDMTIKDYAEKAGVAYQRLSRVLRGAEVMKLEDMATAQRVLGLNLLGC